MVSFVFWVSSVLDLLLAPPSELEWIFQDSWHRSFYLVQCCQDPPSETPRIHPWSIGYVRVYMFPCLGDIFAFPGFFLFDFHEEGLLGKAL